MNTSTKSLLSPALVDWLNRVYIPSRGSASITPPPAGSPLARQYDLIHGSIAAKEAGRLKQFLNQNRATIFEVAPKNRAFALYGTKAPFLRISWPGSGDAIVGTSNPFLSADLKKTLAGKQPAGLFVIPQKPGKEKRRQPTSKTAPLQALPPINLAGTSFLTPPAEGQGQGGGGLSLVVLAIAALAVWFFLRK